jgi:hypothetical protein
MTVNSLQLKTGVGIIVYMDIKVKSKQFVVFVMLDVWILVLWLSDTVLYPED